MQSPEPARLPFVWVGILFESALGALAWLLGWVLGQPALEHLQWSGRDAAVGTIATMPMLLLFLGCLRYPVGPLARIKQLSEEVITPLFASCGLVELAVLALVAGLSEEMLFRGFLQNYLVRTIHFWPGILAASVVFGLFHLLTPTYAALATLLGLYLGGLFVATGNLLAVIVAHALYDFLALVYLLRARPEESRSP